jgi:hypothetical protein
VIYVNVFIGRADYARSNKIRSTKLAVAKYSPSISTVIAPVTLLRGSGLRVSLFDRRVCGRQNEAAVGVFRRNNPHKYQSGHDQGDDPPNAYVVVFPGWESLRFASGASSRVSRQGMIITFLTTSECHFNLQDFQDCGTARPVPAISHEVIAAKERAAVRIWRIRFTASAGASAEAVIRRVHPRQSSYICMVPQAPLPVADQTRNPASRTSTGKEPASVQESSKVEVPPLPMGLRGRRSVFHMPSLWRNNTRRQLCRTRRGSNGSSSHHRH